MSRDLSVNLLNQLFAQNSDDPFLLLLTLEHVSFSSTIRIVNNNENITSNGDVFTAFPLKVTLPVEDGETERSLQMVVDNVSLALIGELRSVTDPVDVKVQMVLASNPDVIEIEYGEMKLGNITYDSQRIQGSLYLDDFLNTDMNSEKYTPTKYPGVFQ